MDTLRSARRINVIGTSGSGKTTFGRELSALLSLPFIEMDKIFWGPNWLPSGDQEFLTKLETALSTQRWVLDGNYNRTRAIKWKHVDVVIWLDYSFSRTLLQAVRRALRRSLSGEEIWEGTGNRESFRKSFFSKQSIILWTVQTYGSMKKRYAELVQDKDSQHITFIRLTSPREAAKLLSELRKDTP